MVLLAILVTGCGSDELPTVTPEMEAEMEANASPDAPPVRPPPPGAQPTGPNRYQTSTRRIAPPPPRPVVVPDQNDQNENLLQLTRELRKWVLRNQRPPKNYEEFARSSRIQAPPPPPGKKYAIGKPMKVVLVNR